MSQKWIGKLRASNRRGLALGALVVIALAVRLHDLDAESIWRDEAYSIAMAARSPVDIVSETAAKDTTPPLYYLLLHGWQRAFGDSPTAVRMPSVLAGTLAVPLAYLVAAPLMGPIGGLIAALLHALSPLLVAYSQETRQYALLSCVSLASFFFLIRLAAGRRFAVPAYIVAAILTCYTHSVGIFVLGAQMVFVGSSALLSATSYWRRALVAQALAAAAFLPWVLVTLQQYRQLDAGFWIQPPTLASLASTLHSYANSPLLVRLCIVLAVLGFAEITVAGTTPYRNVIRALDPKAWSIRIGDMWCSWLLVCWLLVPVVGLFVISRVGTPIYVNRATIAAASAFYLLVARGLTQLRGLLRTVVLATVCVLFGVELVDYYRTVTKEQWREMVADVSPLVEPGDVFVFHQAHRWYAFNYYFRDRGIRRISFPDREYNYDEVVTQKEIESFPNMVDDHTRVWLVLVSSRDRDALIRNYLRRTRPEFFHQRYKGFEVYGFEKSAGEVLQSKRMGTVQR